MAKQSVDPDEIREFFEIERAKHCRKISVKDIAKKQRRQEERDILRQEIDNKVDRSAPSDREW